MTKTELRQKVDATGSHFFDFKTMKFHGDTMKNYGVRSAVVDTWSENGVECWELYRIHPTKLGVQSSAYFDKDNFSRVYNKI